VDLRSATGTEVSYLRPFAELLKATRERANLSARQLGREINYSHSQVVRAAGGDTVPAWPLVRAYLDGCRLGGWQIHQWWILWSTTKAAEKRLKEPTDDDQGWFWELQATTWQAAIEALQEPDPFLVQLSEIEDRQQLGQAIAILAKRNETESLRAIEATTGIPRTTLQGWWVGKRRPSPQRLDQLVIALGATRAEQRAFAECLERIGDAACGELCVANGQLCYRDEGHKGPHTTDDGASWLEDGVITEGLPARWTGEFATGRRGPHW
jgi:transcriptional regulator with XRE-family HTH domain